MRKEKKEKEQNEIKKSFQLLFPSFMDNDDDDALHTCFV